MPIIASQHRCKHADHIPYLLAWPEDCTVQWGKGVVLGENSYSTAFFEAFPKRGGFIRGEGATIAEAESRAFAQYNKEEACDHAWGRRGYLNGGTRCTRCKGFATTMKPVMRLGAFRDPISFHELEFALEGYLQPNADDRPEDVSHKRRSRLRLRQAGLPIPEPEGFRPHRDLFGDPTPYARACEDAILGEIHARGGVIAMMTVSESTSAISGFFEKMALSSAQRAYTRWCETRGLTPHA